MSKRISMTLVTMLAAVLVGCPTATQPIDSGPVDAGRCHGATNCADCLRLNTMSRSCGWSIAQARCLDADPMNYYRSADLSSTGNDWAPAPGLCPGSMVCQGITDCVACDTSGQGCGWCRNGNRCMPGISGSSQDGTCTGNDWETRGAYCPNADTYCAGHATSCLDCTRTPICGVCSGTTVCRPGTGSGPLSGSTQEMCPGFWAWVSNDCMNYDSGVQDGSTDASNPEAGPVDSGMVADAAD